VKDLVILRDRRAVTSSLVLAEAFKKEHKNVLRDIKNLNLDQLNFEQMFTEGTEPDLYGRDRKIYYMNRDGFTLLAMGFTGKQALDFKIRYIKAFNRMEEYGRNQERLPKTPQEKLALLLENVGASNQKVDELDDRVTDIEENTPIAPGDYNYISRRINQRVSEVARGYGNLTSKQRGELFKDINQGVKRVTGVGSRSQLRKKHYNLAVGFINDWEPSTATKAVVRQMSMNLEV
jgi:Rha family phage regulatory protein